MFAWLRKLFAGSPRTTDLPSAPDRPSPSRGMRLVITAADEIWLEGQVISLAEFQALLPQYIDDVVFYYQRENTELPASSLALEVVDSVARALPSEA